MGNGNCAAAAPCRKGVKLDGNAPMLLNGYGSYEIANDPYFSANKCVHQ